MSVDKCSNQVYRESRQIVGFGNVAKLLRRLFLEEGEEGAFFGGGFEGFFVDVGCHVVGCVWEEVEFDGDGLFGEGVGARGVDA